MIDRCSKCVILLVNPIHLKQCHSERNASKIEVRNKLLRHSPPTVSPNSPIQAIEFFAVCTHVADLTFLPMLYIWTDASMLSDVKMLSWVKDLIPDICGQHSNNLELYKY